MITSGNFKLDKDGHVTANNLDINGGNIILSDDGTTAYEGKLRIQGNSSNAFVTGLYSQGLVVRKKGSSTNTISHPSIFLTMYDGSPRFSMCSSSQVVANIRYEHISFSLKNNVTFSVDGSNKQAALTGVTAFYVNGNIVQTSRKSKKKNISDLKVNATELIRNTDIRAYNLKGEKPKSKKHFGLIIDDTNDYNCPDEVISEDRQGVELYSMITLAWKAIQELNGRVEILEVNKS